MILSSCTITEKWLIPSFPCTLGSILSSYSSPTRRSLKSPPTPRASVNPRQIPKTAQQAPKPRAPLKFRSEGTPRDTGYSPFRSAFTLHTKPLPKSQLPCKAHFRERTRYLGDLILFGLAKSTSRAKDRAKSDINRYRIRPKKVEV